MASEGTRDRVSARPWARRYFRLYASPSSWLLGLLWGILYAWMKHDLQWGFASRMLVACLFIGAGVMGVAYFWGNIARRYVVPYLTDQHQQFYFLWLFFGLVFVLIAINSDEPPDPGVLEALQSLLVGTIVGHVFGQGLTLFAGRKLNVGEWEVIPFPRWIVHILMWLWRLSTQSLEYFKRQLWRR